MVVHVVDNSFNRRNTDRAETHIRDLNVAVNYNVTDLVQCNPVLELVVVLLMGHYL